MLFWSLCPLKPIQNIWESRRVSYVFLLKIETPNAVLCSVWGRKQCLLEKSWMCASVLPWILPDPTFVDESNVEEFLVIFICPRTCCFSGSGKCYLFLLYCACSDSGTWSAHKPSVWSVCSFPFFSWLDLWVCPLLILLSLTVPSFEEPSNSRWGRLFTACTAHSSVPHWGLCKTASS